MIWIVTGCIGALALSWCAGWFAGYGYTQQGLLVVLRYLIDHPGDVTTLELHMNTGLGIATVHKLVDILEQYDIAGTRLSPGSAARAMFPVRTVWLMQRTDS